MNVHIQSSGNNSNFVQPLNEVIKQGSKVTLEYVSIPYTFYNVTSNNNTFSFDSGAVSGTIEPGNYSFTEILDLLATATSYTWSYSDVTNKITITNGAAFVIDEPSEDSILRDLGFTELSPSALVHESSNEPNLVFKSSVSVVIQELTDSNWIQTCSAFTYLLPINEGKSSIIVYNRKDSFDQEAYSHNSMSKLTIRVQDSNGRLVEGLSRWEMVLKVHN